MLALASVRSGGHCFGLAHLVSDVQKVIRSGADALVRAGPLVRLSRHTRYSGRRGRRTRGPGVRPTSRILE